LSKFVVDTHALIWFLARNSRLGGTARDALSNPGSHLVLPSIALAEALWIVSSRQVGIEAAELLEAIDSDPRITVYPLTREIVEIAQGVSAVAEMHDRQIVATALHLSTESESFVLLTRDENIVGFGVVPVAW
jgi:PIN domain nuclease of toxin-antitoxin system